MSNREELLQIEVAGTTITLDVAEAALVLYADCKYRGEKVTIIYNGGIHADAYIVERKVGDSSICAAIFPRIQSPHHYSKEVQILLASASIKFRLGNNDRVTAYEGNVTEAYLREG